MCGPLQAGLTTELQLIADCVTETGSDCKHRSIIQNCSKVLTKSQAVARIADRTAKKCRVALPRPRPLSAKIISAPAWHCPYKTVYQI